MIAGILGLVVGQAASVLGAWALLRPLKTGRATVDLLLLLLLRLLLISGAILIAGWTGTLRASWLAAASGGILCVLLLFRKNRQRPSLSLPSAAPAASGSRSASRSFLIADLPEALL